MLRKTALVQTAVPVPAGRIGVALQVTVENTERSGVICDLGYSKIFTVDTVNRLWFTVESSKTSCDRVTNPV